MTIAVISVVVEFIQMYVIGPFIGELLTTCCKVIHRLLADCWPVIGWFWLVAGGLLADC